MEEVKTTDLNAKLYLVFEDLVSKLSAESRSSFLTLLSYSALVQSLEGEIHKFGFRTFWNDEDTRFILDSQIDS